MSLFNEQALCESNICIAIAISLKLQFLFSIMELGAIKKRKLNALFVENRSTAQNSANKLKNQIDQVFRNEVYEKFIALYQSGMLCDVILIAGVNKQR